MCMYSADVLYLLYLQCCVPFISLPAVADCILDLACTIQGSD